MSESECDYMRDCFDDRICDDLSQLLLSYLSIDDKIQLQCVSKQWKDFIIETIQQLTISRFKSYNKSNNKLFFKIDNIIEIDIKPFESIFKKYKYINSIDIDYNIRDYRYITPKNLTKLFEYIIKNCNNLIKFSYDTCFFDYTPNSDDSDSSYDNIESQTCIARYIGEKFGHSLNEINFHNLMTNESEEILIKLCPNLISLKNVNLRMFSDNNEIIYLEKLNHISHLSINEYNFSYKLIEDFVKTYENQIKHLGLDIRMICNNQSILSVIFDKILLLKNLESLTVNDYHLMLFFTDELLQVLTKFSKQCNQLKTLSLIFYIKNSKQVMNILKIISNFKSLTKLDLYLDYYDSQTLDIDYDNLNWIALENLKNISHLYFHSLLLRDNFFTDIEKYLPKLKTLEIRGNREIITDKALYSLSKLENIVKICFHKKTSFTDKAIVNLFNNCLKLSYIVIYSTIITTNVSFHATIKSFISLASKRPKTLFVFKLNFDKNNTIFGSKVKTIRNIKFIPICSAEDPDVDSE